jgi:hypothetical protein
MNSPYDSRLPGLDPIPLILASFNLVIISQPVEKSSECTIFIFFTNLQPAGDLFCLQESAVIVSQDLEDLMFEGIHLQNEIR